MKKFTKKPNFNDVCLFIVSLIKSTLTKNQNNTSYKLTMFIISSSGHKI